MQVNKTHFLEAIEHILALNLADREKLKKASTNNIAYALKQVHEMNRLEKEKPTQRVAHDVEDVSKLSTPELVKRFNMMIRELNIYNPEK